MARIGVVTDSTAFLPADVRKSHEVPIVPLVVNWDGQSFRDTVDLSTAAFYQRLRGSRSMPTTGAPSLASFVAAYEKVLATCDAVVDVSLASKLSATYDVAVQAAQQVAPERIRVVDSGTLSICMGWMIQRALEMGEQGASLDEIVQTLEDMRARTRVYAALDTLEFLQRGGRIGRAQALAGTLLNVKPIIVIRDGEVHPLERVRTLNGAMRRMTEIVTSLGSLERLGVIDGDAPQPAAELERQLRTLMPNATIDRGELSSVLGTHGGPGVVGVGVLLGR